eukprot:TRINITY_DN8794_c0_g1_i1.p1 TRINITY_DN8794_c0_g1~~TRINITY_DN8794_c0_g1_i1.p1  ORF type:complete len:173 (+),score=2.22 TRINITY_DN8794_c0_g1_i1:222-740(+)
MDLQDRERSNFSSSEVVKVVGVVESPATIQSISLQKIIISSGTWSYNLVNGLIFKTNSSMFEFNFNSSILSVPSMNETLFLISVSVEIIFTDTTVKRFVVEYNNVNRRKVALEGYIQISEIGGEIRGVDPLIIVMTVLAVTILLVCIILFLVKGGTNSQKDNIVNVPSLLFK